MAAPCICSITDCDKPARRRGLCPAHHREALWAASPDGYRCAVEGCERRRHAYGYCGLHGRRFVRHGNPLGGGTYWGDPLRWIADHVSHADKDACLTWPFARDINGLAVVRLDGRAVRAHRVMCELAHGKPPMPNLDTAHDCGHGHLACMNRHHLRWDTRKGNHADKIRHGTHNRGERNLNAKLTTADVRTIRKLRGSVKQSVLAAVYGVTPSHICGVQRGYSWRWLD